MDVTVFTMTMFAVKSAAYDVDGPFIRPVWVFLMEWAENINHLEISTVTDFARQD